MFRNKEGPLYLLVDICTVIPNSVYITKIELGIKCPLVYLQV